MTNQRHANKPATRLARAAQLLIVACLLTVGRGVIAAESRLFNLRACDAVGNGKTLDTPAIQEAIDACAAAGGGQVLFPPGRYLSGTIHLKSNVTLFLDAGATLIGTEDLDQYHQPEIPSFMPEARWGKWHRALILAEGIENIAIAGSGTIDGNKVFDPTGEERMRGPHTFVFVNCTGVTVRDVSFIDSANYAIFFQVSSNVDIRNVTFTGGWDGVHWRGAPDHPCRDVSITACRFFTGDDCIAGRYWENTLISDCIINSSCNGIRLIGPATNLIIHDCLFYGPGLRPHRSSDRHNMLAGINLQPGAWDATKGELDDVAISDISMHNVCTPFHISLKPGNTAGAITVDRVTATGVYRAAASVESWAETPFADVTFCDVTFEYQGAGTPEQARMQVKSPGVDARPLPAWGFYARNVQNLCLDNVRLRCKASDARPVLMCETVDSLSLHDFDFTRPSQFSLDNVAEVQVTHTDIPTTNPRCTELTASPADDSDSIITGRPFSVTATLKNGSRQGLARIEFAFADYKTARCLWLTAGQETRVTFADLPAPTPGIHNLTCAGTSVPFAVLRDAR